ncbi:Ada metal-binding domain-containing protein [Alteromonas lipolytica]|uniref:HTH araC/xylS-type domain-containing protein n=1 Tax=Alteromonas lipolytica TaxID=1856405 RepID=A0A1E8FJI1_9ALTE|nr:Ada metal-binding domain-containing protein [Alteromonas lipolytica]OFI35593.1 hypothetical protein BFC17_12615 [Alteromonas lipolytica]GGF77467.1 3-methyladenine DNA glycosylase [Alteromonas lipolytica]
MPDTAQQQQFAIARQSRDPRFDGRFFVAVKTTGIFCRPICPARLPDEQNVSYYLYAQQAIEQGFRPCLRCRPDSAPGSFAWRGVQTTSQRALRLLSEELGSSISDIAQRLGISERYLGQLVNEEVGLSPKRFQLHSRLLLAKRLLQQTVMPVTDVALAAGFQSARSLHSHFKKDFGLTPGDLRRQECKQDSAALITLFLPVRQPYNWPQVRDFLALRAVPSTETLTTDCYSRAFVINDYTGFVSARYQPAKGGFDVAIELSQPQQLPPLLVTLRRVLDTDTAAETIEQALLKAGLATEHLTPGLRLPGVWSVFEAGCRAIVGQQISIKAAITQLQRLSCELGAAHPHGQTFPTPQAVAGSTLDMLKMPATRKQALRDFATLVIQANGKALSDSDILAIKGIGPWTLQYLRMRGQSEPDVYLARDLIVAREAGRFGINVEQAAPWRSYLTMQLWQLANKPNGEA